MLNNIKETCTNNVDTLQEAYVSSSLAGTTLVTSLQDLYDSNKNSYISAISPSGASTTTIPIYISNLGPKENNETYTGFENDFFEIRCKIFAYNNYYDNKKVSTTF